MTGPTDDGTDGEVTDVFVRRQDDVEWRQGEADIGTSAEALAVLTRDGVAAWRRWVAERQAAADEGDRAAAGLVLGDDEQVRGPGLGVQARAAQTLSGQRLREYWTRGPGLAKWVSSPTPWRTLHGFLAEYLSGEKLDATTSAWYRIVFGRLPSQD